MLAALLIALLWIDVAVCAFEDGPLLPAAHEGGAVLQGAVEPEAVEVEAGGTEAVTLAEAKTVLPQPADQTRFCSIGERGIAINLPTLGTVEVAVAVLIADKHLPNLLRNHKCVPNSRPFWDALHDHGAFKLVETKLVNGQAMSAEAVRMSLDKVLTDCKEQFRAVVGAVAPGTSVYAQATGADSLNVKWGAGDWKAVNCGSMQQEKQRLYNYFMNGGTVQAVNAANAQFRSDFEGEFKNRYCGDPIPRTPGQEECVTRAGIDGKGSIFRRCEAAQICQEGDSTRYYCPHQCHEQRSCSTNADINDNACPDHWP